MSQPQPYDIAVLNDLNDSSEELSCASYSASICVHLRITLEIFTSSGEIQPNDNKPINCEKMLNNWLNAYEYHHDEKKQHLIEDIGKGFPPSFLDSIFVGMILDKIKAINRFAGLIDRLGAGQVNVSLK